MSVPILLVTGFLGAGKTTFINGLLQDAGGLRIAAIVNDFGSINIDAALLETATDEVIGLKNGCICCSLQGDLLRTLRQVMVQGAPDLIVVEASGVADPQGIVQALMDPVLWQAARLDSIVCVVDAEDLQEAPARWQDPLWQAQVAAADIIQLSKVQAGAEGVANLTARLGAMGKRAVFGADGTARSSRELIGAAAPGPRGGVRRVLDSSRFATLEWRCSGPVPMQPFQQVIGALAPDLLRAKGFLGFTARPGRVLFQMVGQRASLAPHDGGGDGCELVLIGEAARFDPERARAALDALAE